MPSTVSSIALFREKYSIARASKKRRFEIAFFFLVNISTENQKSPLEIDFGAYKGIFYRGGYTIPLQSGKRRYVDNFACPYYYFFFVLMF